MSIARRAKLAMEKWAEEQTVKVVVAFQTAIRPATPIDTGFARAHWIISAPQFRSFPFEQVSKFPYKLGSGPVVVGSDAEYIIYLNMGSSSQAPSAFVQQTLARVVAGIR